MCPMRHYSSPRPGKWGFTLIELLTVITIIAVLIGLLFPVIGSVMNGARKTQAAAEETRIVNAVNSYKTEYGQLPINTAQQGGASYPAYSDTVDGDPAGGYPNACLFDVLRAIPDTIPISSNGVNSYNNPNNALNTKQVVYFQAPNAKNPAQPSGGFLTQPYTTPTATNHPGYGMIAGSLVDPWGNEYIIFLDANGDNDLNSMFVRIYANYNPPLLGPSGAVQVTSMGPDGILGTTGKKSVGPGIDDIISW